MGFFHRKEREKIFHFDLSNALMKINTRNDSKFGWLSNVRTSLVLML